MISLYLRQSVAGIAGGINLYQYVGNNPASFTDPFGLMPCRPPDSPKCTDRIEPTALDPLALLFGGAGSLRALVGRGLAKTGIRNAVPKVLARVVDTEAGVLTELGAPGAADVFVTAADDIAGMTAAQIAQRLGIEASESILLSNSPLTLPRWLHQF